MIGVALKGLLGRKLRAILTAFAIVLGVAMISGSFVLTDTLGASLDGVYQESYKGTDAVISSKHKVQQADGTTEKAPLLVRRPRRHRAGRRRTPRAGLDRGTRHETRRRRGRADREVPHDGSRSPSTNGSRPDPAQPTPARQRRLAQRPDHQIAIDKSTAEKQSFEVGQTVGAFGDGPVRQYELTGIVRYGSVDSLGSATITVFDLPAAQSLFDKVAASSTRSGSAQTRASPRPSCWGRSARCSPRRPRSSPPSSRRARTRVTQQGLNFIKYFLLGFGGIALFVGSFVIANTLAITVAQRLRELATLRTLGASRRQVICSVVPSPRHRLPGSIGGSSSAWRSRVGLTALIERPGSTSRAGHRLLDQDDRRQPGRRHADHAAGEPRPAVRATRIPPIAAVREGAIFPRVALRPLAGLPRSSSRSSLVLFSYGVLAGGLRSGSGSCARRRRPRCSSAWPWSLHASCGRSPPCSVPLAPASRHGRQPGPRERRPKPVPDRLHGGGPDDRPCADHLRGGARRGRSQPVHGRGQSAVRRRLRVGRLRASRLDKAAARRGRHRRRGVSSSAAARRRRGAVTSPGSTPNLTQVDRHDWTERPTHAGPTRQQRRVRRRPYAEDHYLSRLAHPMKTPTGERSRSGHGHLRPAERRLAVRRGRRSRRTPSTTRSQTTTNELTR